MRTCEKLLHGHAKFKAALALTALAILATLPVAAPASTGGIGSSSSHARAGKARLVHGKAIAPSNAPRRVVRVIAAANRIAKHKDYCYGGGHASFKSSCYDCSGSVSYALHGGRFLESPLPSGPMESWGLEGEGRWITVYANPGHAYAVIAGFRWDTSGDSGGETGPRWHEDLRDNVGYVARHPAGF